EELHSVLLHDDSVSSFADFNEPLVWSARQFGEMRVRLIAPITIFDQRRRPRGLEFSACQPCNSGGRIAEKIVGLVTAERHRGAEKALPRIRTLSPRSLERNVAGGRPARQIPTATGQSARRCAPVQRTRTPSERSNEPVRCKARPCSAFRDDGHYRFICRSRRCPRWYPNYQVYTEGIPNVLLEAVGNPGTLVQGKWSVGDQFLYASARTPNGKQSLFVARFREAFAVAGMVYDELGPPEVEGFPVARPVFLRSNS